MKRFFLSLLLLIPLLGFSQENANVGSITLAGSLGITPKDTTTFTLGGLIAPNGTIIVGNGLNAYIKKAVGWKAFSTGGAGTTYTASQGLTLTGTNFTLGGTLTGGTLTTINSNTGNGTLFQMFDATGHGGNFQVSPAFSIMTQNSNTNPNGMTERFSDTNITFEYPTSTTIAKFDGANNQMLFTPNFLLSSLGNTTTSNLSLATGNASAGTSGNLNFNTGTSTTTSGNINFSTGVGTTANGVIQSLSKHLFTASATLPGINVGSIAGDPTTLVNGDVWFNSTNVSFRGNNAGAKYFIMSSTSPASAAIPVYTGTSGLVTNNANFAYTSPALTVPHILGQGAAPGTAAGTGAGTGPTISLTTASDMKGIINVTTGTTPAASAAIITLTFAVAYGAAPIVVISPNNAVTAALLVTQDIFATSTTTTLVLNSNAVALTAATAYSWTYHVIQ